MAKSFNEITFKYKTNFINRVSLFVSIFLISIIGLSIFSLLNSGFKSEDAFLTNEDIFEIIKFTFVQSFLSVFLSLLLGFLGAKILFDIKSVLFKKIVISLTSIAFVLPTVVACIGLIKVWGGDGVLHLVRLTLNLNKNELTLYGLFGILLAHVFFNAPLFLRVFYNCFQIIPVNYLKNANQFNITGIRFFKLIEWPFIKETLPLLCGVVFLQCFTSFSLILMLGGGPSATTLEVAIYTAVRYDFDLKSAAVLASFQLFICLIVILFLDLFSSNKISNLQIKTNYLSYNLYKKNTFKNNIQKFIILLAYFLIIILPLIALVVSGLSLKIFEILKNQNTYIVFLNSIFIAIISSFITVSISWFISETRANIVMKYDNTFKDTLMKKFINLSIMLYLAVPAIVLGTGLFILLKGFVSYNYFPILILIFSNVMLCLPFSVNIIQSHSIYLRRKHDKLCSSLGLRGWNRFIIIDFPAMKNVFGLSLGLCACLSLGDLSVIALFGSQNFQTIPWLIFQYMSTYRINEAASVSCLLIITCYLFFIFFSKMLGSKYVNN